MFVQFSVVQYFELLTCKMEFLKLFLTITFIIKSSEAGGDDPCYNPTLPFNRSLILEELHQIEYVVKFLNTSVSTLIDETASNTVQILEILNSALGILNQFQNLFNQANLNIKTESEITTIESLIDDVNAGKNVKDKFVDCISIETSNYLDLILNQAYSSIAIQIGLTSENIFEIIAIAESISFPLSCIIEDIAYLKVLITSIQIKMLVHQENAITELEN